MSCPRCGEEMVSAFDDSCIWCANLDCPECLPNVKKQMRRKMPKKKYQAFFQVAPITVAPASLWGYAVVCAGVAVWQSTSEIEAKQYARKLNRALLKWQRECLP